MVAPFSLLRCGIPFVGVPSHDIGLSTTFRPIPLQRGKTASAWQYSALAYAPLLLAAWLPFQASAQDRDAAIRRYTPPLRIEWELAVLTDGKQTDKLSGNTAVGQSATVTRHWDVQHTVGCEGAQTQPVPFSRTVTLSPLGVDSHQVIGFSVDTQETIDDDPPQTVRSDVCALPPTRRIITAHHPEWDLGPGQTVSWTIVPKHPTLVYQLTAHVVGAGAVPASASASASASAPATASSPSGAASQPGAQ